MKIVLMFLLVVMFTNCDDKESDDQLPAPQRLHKN